MNQSEDLKRLSTRCHTPSAPAAAHRSRPIEHLPTSSAAAVSGRGAVVRYRPRPCPPPCSPCTTRPASSTSPAVSSRPAGSCCRAAGRRRRSPAADLPVTDVADVTGLPAILGHRVVTLHPKVHGGILADLDDPEHQRDLAEHGIEPIALVVVNLYPFASDPSVELIDIGGPAMVRAAAKNHAHVGVVVDPADYGDGARRDHRVRRRSARRRGGAWPATRSPRPRPTTRRSSTGSTASPAARVAAPTRCPASCRPR